MSAAGSPRTAFGFERRGASLARPGSPPYMWACWVAVAAVVATPSRIRMVLCSTAELGCCFIVFFVDRGRGGEVMGDGLAGADKL